MKWADTESFFVRVNNATSVIVAVYCGMIQEEDERCLWFVVVSFVKMWDGVSMGRILRNVTRGCHGER